MKVGSLGVWFSTNSKAIANSENANRKRFVDFIQSTDELGYSVLWYPEAMSFEAMAMGSFLLSQTRTILVGSGIANIYARDPSSAILGHNALNNLYGNRFVLGLGVSHQPIVENARGHKYTKPLKAMKQYLERMDNESINLQSQERKLVLAALGPKMLKLAADRAEGALPYNVTPEHTVRAREILGVGKSLCVEQKICLTKDSSTARRVAANELKRYMVLPNYRNCWLSLGFSQEDFEHGGSNRFLDAMVAWGDDATIENRLREHYDAGADHVCIQPLDPEESGFPCKKAIAAFAPAAKK